MIAKYRSITVLTIVLLIGLAGQVSAAPTTTTQPGQSITICRTYSQTLTRRGDILTSISRCNGRWYGKTTYSLPSYTLIGAWYWNGYYWVSVY